MPTHSNTQPPWQLSLKSRGGCAGEGKCASSLTSPSRLCHARVWMAFQWELLNLRLKPQHFRYKSEPLLSEENRDMKVRWDLNHLLEPQEDL